LNATILDLGFDRTLLRLRVANLAIAGQGDRDYTESSQGEGRI